jgi:hypothetical protein
MPGWISLIDSDQIVYSNKVGVEAGMRPQQALKKFAKR